jgi:cation transport ATPase
MEKTIFEISKMDCPSEENLIRIKLDGISGIQDLDFDIPNRRLTVFHNGQLDLIEKAILDLHLDGRKRSTEQADHTRREKDTQQKRLLWAVLAINFSFFLIEMTTGLISGSMGLVADSLDMLADAFVYGISLGQWAGRLSGKNGWPDLPDIFR